MTEYIIELWNPKKNQYEFYWKGINEERAWITYNKSYVAIHTRRMKKITTEIVKKSKKSDRWNFRRNK